MRTLRGSLRAITAMTRRWRRTTTTLPQSLRLWQALGAWVTWLPPSHNRRFPSVTCLHLHHRLYHLHACPPPRLPPWTLVTAWTWVWVQLIEGLWVMCVWGGECLGGWGGASVCVCACVCVCLLAQILVKATPWACGRSCADWRPETSFSILRSDVCWF